MNNNRGYLLLLLGFATLLIVAACTQTAATPATTPTPVPTATALPAPTGTSEPTATPEPPATSVPTIEPGDVERQVTVNDRERSYLLHIPPGLNSQEPVPVVFAFHQFNGTPSGMRAMTDFNDIADEAIFLVVYPQGVGNSWNVEEGVIGDASAENVDEFSFVRQMLSDLGTIASIDPDRVYAAGFSQGGGLAYALACEMSGTFAAIAPLAGTIGNSPCQPEEAVSVIHVHGLTDGVVPYSGGGRYDLPSVEESLDTLAQVAGCTGSEVEQPSDIITRTVRTGCQAGKAMELYTIEPLTHRWPPEDMFPASETIWDFFAAHPKP